MIRGNSASTVRYLQRSMTERVDNALFNRPAGGLYLRTSRWMVLVHVEDGDVESGIVIPV